MDDLMPAVPSACPDPDRWLDVAAGTENPEMSLSLSAHAAGCASCARYFREAIRIMADEQHSAEEQLLADLKSSDPSWQRGLAQELTGPVEQARQTSRLSLIKRRRWPFVGASIAATLVLGFFSLEMFRSRHPSSPSVAEAPVNGTPKVILEGSSGAKITAEPGLANPSAGTLVLEPGATRGVDGPPRLSLAPGIHAVPVTLILIEDPPLKLSLTLRNESERPLWNKDVELKAAGVKLPRITINIPTKDLSPGYYSILAKDATAKDKDDVAVYAFRVIP